MDMKVSLQAGRVGTAEIRHFEVEKNSIEAMRLALRGRGVAPGIYTALHIDRVGLMMSDTPAEQRDHYSPVYNAKGSVLIMGLGIAMVTSAVLKKPEVTDVTVIEINPVVIALVGPQIADPRLTIIAADAMTWKPPKDKRYGMVWHDIWPHISTDNLKQMGTLKRRYARKADWQGCWCEAEIRRVKRQDRRYY